jgi:Phosphatase
VSARGRPPRLEPRVGESRAAPPPTAVQLLERAKVAGSSGGPGPTELARFVERVVAGDRRALGALAPMEGLTAPDVWHALGEAFGASRARPGIDGARTLEATGRAAARVAAVAARAGRIAMATGSPASLLGVYLAFARLARVQGAELVELPDVGPIRADGRSRRWLRWIDGVAVVTDGEALVATRDAAVARELLFVMPRPALVVGDGPFAEVAWTAGIEVVALAGLDQAGWAVAATLGSACTLVPLRTDRPPRAYAPVSQRIDVIARVGETL